MAMLRAALYCRLSKDDMLQGDSESIKTQKTMLTQYAKEHGFLVVEIYVDDGYSGLNFDRPSFNRMLDDIEAGKIDVVITKDYCAIMGLIRETLKIKDFWLSPFFFDLKEEQSHDNQRIGSKPAGGGFGGTLYMPIPVALPTMKGVHYETGNFGL